MLDLANDPICLNRVNIRITFRRVSAGGEGGGVTAKQDTTVQDCVSAFASAEPNVDWWLGLVFWMLPARILTLICLFRGLFIKKILKILNGNF